MTVSAPTVRTHAGRLAAALALCVALVAALAGAGQADPLPAPGAYPKVAFVARNDVPFDSLSVGPVAGALGGIVVITSPTSLGDPARDALVAFAPDLVVIAGGTAAISSDTAAAVDAAGPWSVVRKSGPTRDDTAAALASVLDDLGVDRPGLVGDGQVIGDLSVGGQVHADTLAVESDTHVANLNADLLDGLDSTDFLANDARGVAAFGTRVGADGTRRGWFNTAGGEPNVVKLGGNGQYRIDIPGVTLDADNFVVSATPDLGQNQIGATFTPAGSIIVTTYDAAGVLQDATFNVTAWSASNDG